MFKVRLDGSGGRLVATLSRRRFPFHGRGACNQITSSNRKHFRTLVEVLEDCGTRMGSGKSEEEGAEVWWHRRQSHSPSSYATWEMKAETTRSETESRKTWEVRGRCSVDLVLFNDLLTHCPDLIASELKLTSPCQVSFAHDHSQWVISPCPCLTPHFVAIKIIPCTSVDSSSSIMTFSGINLLLCARLWGFF